MTQGRERWSCGMSIHAAPDISPRRDSDSRLSGYEPDALPLSYGAEKRKGRRVCLRPVSFGFELSLPGDRRHERIHPGIPTACDDLFVLFYEVHIYKSRTGGVRSSRSLAFRKTTIRRLCSPDYLQVSGIVKNDFNCLFRE